MGRGRRSKRGTSDGPNWVEVGGLAVGAVGVVVAIVALLVSSGSSNGGDSSNAASNTRSGDLAAVSMRVHDLSPFEEGRVFLEVTLHNKGARLIVVDSARFEVQRVYKLSRCASQADILVSHVYGLSMPVGAHEGDTFAAPLHQQVGPDEADRFRIGLSTELPADDQTSVYLFVVKVSLGNDGPHPDLPLGTVVVGLPELPTPGEYYWDPGTHEVVRQIAASSPGYVDYLRRVALPCWRSNTADLKAVLGGDRIASGTLKRLVGELVPPSAAPLE